MIHEENLKALKTELEKLILGKTIDAWSCCCGKIKRPVSIVTNIDEPNYSEIVVHWFCWEVKTSENFSTTLDYFLEVNQIELLFAKYEPLFIEEVKNEIRQQ